MFPRFVCILCLQRILIKNRRWYTTMKAKYETERTKNAGQMRILNSGKCGKDNTKGYLWAGYHGGMLQETFSREKKIQSLEKRIWEIYEKRWEMSENSTPSRDEIKTRVERAREIERERQRASKFRRENSYLLLG